MNFALTPFRKGAKAKRKGAKAKRARGASRLCLATFRRRARFALIRLLMSLPAACPSSCAHARATAACFLIFTVRAPFESPWRGVPPQDMTNISALPGRHWIMTEIGEFNFRLLGAAHERRGLDRFWWHLLCLSGCCYLPCRRQPPLALCWSSLHGSLLWRWRM